MIRHTSSDTYTPTGGTPWCSGTVNTKWIPRKPKISAYCKETLRKLAISENFTFYLHMLSICIGRTSWCAPSALQFCSLEQGSYIWAESSVVSDLCHGLSTDDAMMVQSVWVQPLYMCQQVMCYKRNPSPWLHHMTTHSVCLYRVIPRDLSLYALIPEHLAWPQLLLTVIVICVTNAT